MLITKRELIEINACEEGLERFIEQTGDTEEPVDICFSSKGLITDLDVVWLASKSIPIYVLRGLACKCALINLELIKQYTTEYGVIVKVLENHIDVDSKTKWLAYKYSKQACTEAIINKDYNVADAAGSASNAIRSLLAGSPARSSASTIYAGDSILCASDISADLVGGLLTKVFEKYRDNYVDN